MIRLSALLVALVSASCASTPTDPTVGWRDGMQELFDNGSVDPDEPPRHLWEHQDEEALLKRMGYADVVAVGTLRLVGQFTDHSLPSQLSLAFAPDEVLYGSLDDKLDAQRELMLRLDPGSRDFHVALRIQQQLPGTRYLVFLKQQPSRQRRLVWSFYKPSKRLMAEVRAQFRMLRLSRPRT